MLTLSASKENVYAWVWGGNYGTKDTPQLVPVTQNGSDLVLAINDSATGLLLLKTSEAIDSDDYNDFPSNVVKQSSDITTIREDATLTYIGVDSGTSKSIFK